MHRKPLRILACGLALAVVFAAIVGIGYAVVRLVPDWLDESEGLKPDEAALERGRIRTAALVFIGGVVAALGAVFTGLTFRLSRRGQGTDRFNKAVELMGHAQRSVRIGGIHALGHLAREDPQRHHRPVLEVMLAYVRDQSAWPPVAAPAASVAEAAADVPEAPADVKAAMAVLTRRKTAYDPNGLLMDLSNTNLRGIEASGIHLKGALLANTQLQDADLSDARLEAAAFVSARLDGANLDNATLNEKTSFEKARVVGSSFRKAKGVEKADFSQAIHDPVTTDWPNGVAPAGVVTEQSGDGRGLAGDERRELTRLQLENRRLLRERETLRAAAAFFMTQADPP